MLIEELWWLVWKTNLERGYIEYYFFFAFVLEDSKTLVYQKIKLELNRK